MTLRESAGFHSGAVWQAPNRLRIVLTWLDDNQWALMSDPERSRHGGYCMIPHSDINKQWLWEGNQLAARLDGWTYLPDESLGPLISKSAAAPVPAREWVPVGERLPEVHERVVFWSTNWPATTYPGYGFTLSGRWFDMTNPDRDGLSTQCPNITHWCALPPPPATDNEWVKPGEGLPDENWK